MESKSMKKLSSMEFFFEYKSCEIRRLWAKAQNFLIMKGEKDNYTYFFEATKKIHSFEQIIFKNHIFIPHDKI